MLFYLGIKNYNPLMAKWYATWNTSGRAVAPLGGLRRINVDELYAFELTPKQRGYWYMTGYLGNGVRVESYPQSERSGAWVKTLDLPDTWDGKTMIFDWQSGALQEVVISPPPEGTPTPVPTNSSVAPFLIAGGIIIGLSTLATLISKARRK